MKNVPTHALFGWLLLFGCFACQKNIPTDRFSLADPSALDSVLNHFVENDYFPFLYARLEALDGTVLYEHAAVNDNLLPETEINGNSWIRIWSMSKIVTICLALDLIEDGILKFDDPVEQYIPEFGGMKVAVTETGQSLTEFEWGNRSQVCPVKLVASDSEMTVRHLINHQAGFYYAVTGFSCLDSLVAAQNLPKARNSDELIDRLAKLPLVQHPGTEYFYGTNTTVLGLVAERATGKGLNQLVRERITGPMKIEGLQYGLPSGVALLPRFTGRDSLLRQALPGELDIFGPDVPDYDPAHYLYLGGEGMLATADGYADFVQDVTESRHVKRAPFPGEKNG